MQILVTGMVSCSRFIWITNSSNHRIVWPANLLYKKKLASPLGHKALCPSGLGKDFPCKRFAVQTFLWSQKFVIQINLEHGTIAVWNLARSWRISTNISYFSCPASVLLNLWVRTCSIAIWIKYQILSL